MFRTISHLLARWGVTMNEEFFTKDEVRRLAEYEALYSVITELRAQQHEDTLAFNRLWGLYIRITEADKALVSRAWAPVKAEDGPEIISIPGGYA